MFHHRRWKNNIIPKSTKSKAYDDSSLPPMYHLKSRILKLSVNLKEADGLWDWKVLIE